MPIWTTAVVAEGCTTTSVLRPLNVLALHDYERVCCKDKRTSAVQPQPPQPPPPEAPPQAHPVVFVRAALQNPGQGSSRWETDSSIDSSACAMQMLVEAEEEAHLWRSASDADVEEESPPRRNGVWERVVSLFEPAIRDLRACSLSVPQGVHGSSQAAIRWDSSPPRTPSAADPSRNESSSSPSNPPSATRTATSMKRRRSHSTDLSEVMTQLEVDAPVDVDAGSG